MEVNWNLAWFASDRDNYILHYLLSIGKLIFSSLSECGDDFYQPKLKQWDFFEAEISWKHLAH